MGMLLIGGATALRGQTASACILKILSGETPAESPPPVGPAGGSGSAPFYANKGPWGKLQCFYVFIEAPTEMMDELPTPDTKTKWSFPASDAARLPGLFEEAGLPRSFSEALLDPARRIIEDGKICLFPPLEMLAAMTPAMRNVIYPELAKLPDNKYHVSPVLITTDTVEEWYRSSALSPEIVSGIRRMAYHRGDCIAFSDLPAILNYARSDSEARQIYKACTRTRTLMVNLELPKNDTNVDEILDYWSTGLGLRRNDVEPIIESIIETDGVDRLDIVHILPALTRRLLYTYPDGEMSREGILPDCHWTSLNFFNYSPHEYLLDGRLATSSVLENFHAVDPPYQYGDILFFVDALRGDAFHSCVYLADDIVYTKNGRNVFSPWILTKLADVKKIYFSGTSGRVEAYRHKEIVHNARKQQEITAATRDEVLPRRH